MQAMKNHKYIPKSLIFSFNPGKSVGAELYRLSVSVYNLSFSSLVFACLVIFISILLLSFTNAQSSIMFSILFSITKNNLNKNRTLLKKKSIYKISKYTMMNRVLGTATKTALDVVPLINTPITRECSVFIMTNQESSQDTSNTNHPVGVEVSCEASNCKNTNCSQNISECDPSTLIAKQAFHLTNDPKSVEPERLVVELKQEDNKPVFAVIHDIPEPVEHAYEQYNYSLTLMIQKDTNTSIIQKAFKKEEENNNDDKTNNT